MIDALHSMLYSDFRHNNERDFSKSPDQPASLWSMLHEQSTRPAFANKAFDPAAQGRCSPPPSSRPHHHPLSRKDDEGDSICPPRPSMDVSGD